MLIDFPTYINIKCEKCQIVTLHSTITGYPDIPNKPKYDMAKCIVCGNTFILDDWYKEYIRKTCISLIIPKVEGYSV